MDFKLNLTKKQRQKLEDQHTHAISQADHKIVRRASGFATFWFARLSHLK